jgi:tetratricopeptide (TPR) repeat protein
MAMSLRLADGLWSRCTMLLEQGQVAQASHLLRRLLQLEIPQSIRTEASMTLASLCRSTGDYQNARKHVSAALAGDPEDPCLHHMLGYLNDEDEEGSDARALMHLKKAVKLAPDSSECHRALGEYLYKQGQAYKGMMELKTAVELEPDNVDSMATLVECLCDLGEADEAKNQLRLMQFRLGKGHPGIQRLWNIVTYASAQYQQMMRRPEQTIRMPKPVKVKAKTKSSDQPAHILRFDMAHASLKRHSRLSPKP